MLRLIILLLIAAVGVALPSSSRPADQLSGDSPYRAAESATFDYVVVGGGTAGLTIAARLAQQRFQVAVIEAGGYYEVIRPFTRIPGAASLGAGADIRTATSVDWGFVVHGVPGADYRDIHYPRGKCLGGSYGYDNLDGGDMPTNSSNLGQLPIS